jgi:ADP-ribose pyrophosphatase YjhB (NUDIX family)
MSNSQVISFRASGHFLNWIESQRLDDESLSQAAMRILKEMSGVSTVLSTILSTSNRDSVASTEVSTISAEIVDTQIKAQLEPVLAQMAAMEERLGKLRA